MNGNDAIVILFGMAFLVFFMMFIYDMTKLYKSAFDRTEYLRGYKDGVNDATKVEYHVINNKR